MSPWKGAQSAYDQSGTVPAVGHFPSTCGAASISVGRADQKSDRRPRTARASISAGRADQRVTAAHTQHQRGARGSESDRDCSDQDQLLPRSVEALTVARARSASAGGWHNLIVTEEGALHLFGMSFEWRLGHGSVAARGSSEEAGERRATAIEAVAPG